MMKKEFYIYIDDMRQPFIHNAIWVKSYDEAVAAMRNAVEVMNMPITLTIDFDHDLGEEKTGYDFAKWLIEQNYIGKFRIHSMNPVGANNIRQLLKHYGWTEVF
jgi:predicted AlkP superfamily phosphohydrolase/phosphomutase